MSAPQLPLGGRRPFQPWSDRSQLGDNPSRCWRAAAHQGAAVTAGPADGAATAARERAAGRAPRPAADLPGRSRPRPSGPRRPSPRLAAPRRAGLRSVRLRTCRRRDRRAPRSAPRRSRGSTRTGPRDAPATTRPPARRPSPRSMARPSLALHEPVEARHQRAGGVGIVVGVRRPLLVGAQHEPRADQRARPVHPERGADEPDRGDEERGPLAPVVRLPRPALERADLARVEGAHTGSLPS